MKIQNNFSSNDDFTLKPSERNYLRGIILTFSFSVLTILSLWIVNFLATQLNMASIEMFKDIIKWSFDIGTLIAVVQLLLFIIYGFILWLAQCYGEWRK